MCLCHLADGCSAHIEHSKQVLTDQSDISKHLDMSNMLTVTQTYTQLALMLKTVAVPVTIHIMYECYQFQLLYCSHADCQVVQAVRNEQKAKEVATAVDAVSEAARSIGSAQEDATALSGAALQAAAALSSLNSSVDGIAVLPSVQEANQGRGRDSGRGQGWDRSQAESKSFALGKSPVVSL